jgi:hypothetical protein
VRLVGFSPDSCPLVTRRDDETIMLWHLGFSDLGRIVCRTAARRLTDTRPRILLERNKRAAHAVKGRGQVQCRTDSRTAVFESQKRERHNDRSYIGTTSEIDRSPRRESLACPRGNYGNLWETFSDLLMRSVVLSKQRRCSTSERPMMAAIRRWRMATVGK